MVAYDISTVDVDGPRRLAQVAAVCERYGERVQYSVFECRLDAVLLERLVSELLAEMDPRLDSVCIYRLGAPFGDARLSLGVRVHQRSEPWVV